MKRKVSQRGKRLVIVGVIVALGAAIVACSSRAPSDFIGLYYQAGAGDDKKFVECIQPGTSGSYPVDDELFYLPTSLRTWNISPQNGDSDRPIKSGSAPAPELNAAGQPTGGSRPGPEVIAWGTSDFYINWDCEGGASSPVVQFWEKSGRRAWKDGKGIAVDGADGSSFQEDSWRVMLQNVFVTPLEAAIRNETRRYGADAMDANANGEWVAIERQVGPKLNQIMRDKVGGDYLCGPEFKKGEEVTWVEYVPDGVDEKGIPKFRETEKRGKCPPIKFTITGIDFADEGIARSRQDVYKAEQEARKRLVDAQGKADESRILNSIENGTIYLELERVKAQLAAAEACRANPNCTVIIDGGSRGTSLTVAGR